MKARIKIKKYVLVPGAKEAIDDLANGNNVHSPATMVAKEYKKLEAHHLEETQFLIQLVEKHERDARLMHMIYSGIVLAAIVLARIV